MGRIGLGRYRGCVSSNFTIFDLLMFNYEKNVPGSKPN